MAAMRGRSSNASSPPPRCRSDGPPTVRIRPTELGLKGLALFAGLDLAFLATSYSNLFFLMLVFCCALGGLGLWWTFANLRGVTVHLLPVAAGAAAEPRPVQLAVSCGRRPRFDLALAARCGDRLLDLTHLMHADDDATVTVTLPALPRGVHACSAIAITSRYPFGLFRATRTIAQQVEVVAWPRPTAPAGAAGRDGRSEHQAPVGTPGLTLAGLRPFRHGDGPGDVHWKATARRGTPVVKERERERGDRATLWLDRRADGERFERALALAAGFVLQAHEHGRALQLVGQDVDLAAGPARGQRDAALRWLANATSLPADAPAPPALAPDAIDLVRLGEAEAASG